jgi:hypothetical protein
VRLPPALAAAATPRVLELLGAAPGRVLEVDFSGIHATPLRLAGFDVVVVETDPARRAGARERAGEVLAAPPAIPFDAVVATESSDLSGVDARMVLLVRHDGSVWSSASS